MLATQRAKLGDELKCAVAQSHSHARELRKPDAEVVAMGYDDIPELLEIGAKRGQLGQQRGGRKVVVRRHTPKVIRAGRAMPLAGGAQTTKNTWNVP